jgi:ketosteroid isomerase-like protein
MLDVSPAAISSALQRAHKAVDERLPERSQQATLHALGDDEVRAVVERYVQAWEAGDVDAIVAMLTDDAIAAMPPRPTWYRGRPAIRHFLAARPMQLHHRWRLAPVRASGQLALASYGWDEDADTALPHAIQVLTLAGDGRIAEITSFLGMADVRRFTR